MRVNENMRRTKLAVFIVFAFFLVPHLAYADGLYSLQSDTSSNEIQDKTVQEAVPTVDQPIGTTKGSTSGEIFGTRGGYVHPFLSVTEYFTDNVFYSKNNKESDFATILSPGIWLSVPHVYEKLLYIDTANISPGASASVNLSRKPLSVISFICFITRILSNSRNFLPIMQLTIGHRGFFSIT